MGGNLKKNLGANLGIRHECLIILQNLHEDDVLRN
jgi:hypothetical protein